MEFSRRRVLSLLSASGLTAVLTPGLTGTATAAQREGAPQAGQVGDMGRLLSNAVASFAGTAESNARSETAEKLAAVAETARKHLTAMANAGAGELFEGLPLGSDDAALDTTFAQLYEIALATCTPGGELAGDRDAQQRVVAGLRTLHEEYYGDQSAGYYGNWFTWEIGISTSATATLVLLADELADQAPELTETYIDAMDAYLRNGEDGDVDLDSRFHTGANLADITTNRLLQGALLGGGAGEERVRKALEDQLTVYATIDPYHLNHGVTDGHYADGSFVQHSSVAYTGSYGRGLLTRVVQTMRFLEGAGYADLDALVPVVHGWLTEGFAPLVFEGWLMELVKGRAVARPDSGYQDTATIAEAVTDLAGFAEGETATQLQGYVKYLHTATRETPDPGAFASPLTIVRYADLLADDSVPAADLNPPARSTAFNAMDRTVHRRPTWAFALARSSERISKYEYMNSENLLPWFQGEGAHQLYLAGQDQSHVFGLDHYTVVSPYRLAGVTAPVESRATIPELYGKPYYDNPDHPLEFTESSESQNTYVYFPRGTDPHSGGAVLDAYGTAAMVQSDDVPYAQRALLPEDFTVYRNATATKSWFLLDDEIVVLAANVGDRAGRPVTTTLDTRIAAPEGRTTLTGERADGSAWSGTGTGRLRWLRYVDATEETALGYALLPHGRRREQGQLPPLTVALERVSRSPQVVRTANPEAEVTRRVFSAVVQQKASARPLTLAYALVPHASERALRGYAHGPLSVLANSASLQAIRHRELGLTGVNSFGSGRHHLPGLRVDGPACVLVREERGSTQRTSDDRIDLAVSDPTTHRDHVTLLLKGRRARLAATTEHVAVRPVRQGTLLRFDTHQAYGATRTVRLREE